MIKKTVVIEIEATTQENINKKLESLRELFRVHNEFNWGKTTVMEVKTVKDETNNKGLKSNQNEKGTCESKGGVP